jgi:hypothetical protein
VRGICGIPLRDWAFGEPITPTLGAGCKLLDKRELCLKYRSAILHANLDGVVMGAGDHNSPH